VSTVTPTQPARSTGKALALSLEEPCEGCDGTGSIEGAAGIFWRALKRLEPDEADGPPPRPEVCVLCGGSGFVLTELGEIFVELVVRHTTAGAR